MRKLIPKVVTKVTPLPILEFKIQYSSTISGKKKNSLLHLLNDNLHLVVVTMSVRIWSEKAKQKREIKEQVKKECQSQPPPGWNSTKATQIGKGGRKDLVFKYKPSRTYTSFH